MNNSDFEKLLHTASQTVKMEPVDADALLEQLRAVDGLLRALPEPPTVPSLIFREASGTVRAAPIDGRLVLGRAPDCTICFKGYREISQHHFEIVPMSNGYCLRDPGSTNGTFVNQEPCRIRERWLRDGDLIRVAGFSFAFILGGVGDVLPG